MKKPAPLIVAAAFVMGLAQCGAPGSDRYPAVGDLPSRGDAAQLVNALRTERGLTPLRASPALQRVAMAHVRDMESNDFIGHVGSDGRGLRARGRQQGYRACWFGENVAAGQRAAREVVADWYASPSHRRIMLHRRAVEYGLARGPGDKWALVVAEPGCR